MSLLDGLVRLVMRTRDCGAPGALLLAAGSDGPCGATSAVPPGRSSAAPRPPATADRWDGALHHDACELRRSDVDALWQKQRHAVVSAFRNFSALRFLQLPLDGTALLVIEKPLRDVVNAVGRADALSRRQRRRVYDAVLTACAGLPLGMALPSPFGILHDIDRIIATEPELRDAVLNVWTTVDDPDFWMGVSRRFGQAAAV